MSDNPDAEKVDKIRQIFFPYALSMTNAVRERPSRFVYYTTAETACRILQNQELWLRSPSTMNDFLEVEHGIDCLKFAYHSESGKTFVKALDAIFPGLCEESVDYFEKWLPHIRQSTYITCFSEHLDEEDDHGRLSMWRAYGGKAGVALVINGGVMFMENDAVGLIVSPVAYWSQQQVETHLAKITEHVAAEQEFIGGLGRDYLTTIVFQMFRSATLCTKHPGFAEEREWRVIAFPL